MVSNAGPYLTLEPEVSTYRLSITSKLNKQPVRSDTKKIEVMLYTTNSKLSIYNMISKNFEDEFEFT